MPRTDWSPDNAIDTKSDIAKLKLETGEIARIVCLEDPWYEWTHELRMPRVENGKVKMTVKTRKDQSTYEDYVLDFVGNPICLGNDGKIREKGTDPDNCPACEAAERGDGAKKPKRRYAMNVIRYALNQRSEPVVPFSCSCTVWSFTENRATDLRGFAKEYGDLRQRDLILGPCEDKNWQRYDVKVGARALWLTSGDDVKKFVIDTFRNNRIEDLTSACGRQQDRNFMIQDLRKIEERWAIVNSKGVGNDPTAAFDAKPSLADGIAGLNDALVTSSQSAQPVAAAAGPVYPPNPGGEAVTAVDLDSVLTGLAATPPPAPVDIPEPTPQPVASAPVAQPAAAQPAAAAQPQPAPGASTAGFDDIFAGLANL